MKITFIQPYYHNVWEAIGIGYIISYLKKGNYDSYSNKKLEIDFFQAKFDTHDTIIRGSVDSDIVAFSCTSPAYAHGLHLARCIKTINEDVHIVFGGWHPTALPEDVIKETCVDQVIVGEGEESMLQIVLSNNRLDILRNTNISFNAIQWPDRKTIKNKRTIDLCEQMNGRRTASFQMNRGCKVDCVFCSEQTMTGKYNRVHNPIRSRDFNDIIEEIKAVRDEYNIDYFKFVDATFDVSAEQVVQFCMYKIALGLTLEWECNIHPGFVQNEVVFEWLKKANCNQINIGCESGSPKILKKVGKGTSLGQLENVFKWAREYGIKRRGYFILGMPGETQWDIKMTEDLIDKVDPDVVGFTILCPYPGCSLYDHKYHKNIDWSKTDEYSNDFWGTEYHTNFQIKWYQAQLMEKYKDKLCERQSNG